MSSFQIPDLPSWMTLSACRLIDPNEVSFFPEHGAATRAARAVCAECAVRTTCAQFALDHQIDHGLWGGLTPNQRKDARRQELDAEAAIRSAEQPNSRRRPGREKPQRLAERHARIGRIV